MSQQATKVCKLILEVCFTQDWCVSVSKILRMRVRPVYRSGPTMLATISTGNPHSFVRTLCDSKPVAGTYERPLWSGLCRVLLERTRRCREDPTPYMRRVCDIEVCLCSDSLSAVQGKRMNIKRAAMIRALCGAPHQPFLTRRCVRCAAPCGYGGAE